MAASNLFYLLISVIFKIKQRTLNRTAVQSFVMELYLIAKCEQFVVAIQLRGPNLLGLSEHYKKKLVINRIYDKDCVRI